MRSGQARDTDLRRAGSVLEDVASLAPRRIAGPQAYINVVDRSTGRLTVRVDLDEQPAWIASIDDPERLTERVVGPFAQQIEQIEQGSDGDASLKQPEVLEGSASVR